VKQFFAFVKKEFDHILRDTWTTAILILLPVIMLILFGYAMNTDVKDTPFAVIDPSRDEATRAIVERLAASEYFALDRYLADGDEADRAFRDGEIGLAVEFSANFRESMLRSGDARIALVADGSDPNNAITLVNYATGIAGAWLRDNSGTAEMPYEIAAATRVLYNPEMKSAYNFVPGVMGMVLMLICAMMTSISITREKETGTMEVLLVSPVNPLLILLAKTVPYFALSCVNLATIIAFAVFLLRVPVAGSLALLVFVSLLFIFTALSLGILISSMVRQQFVALLISGMGLMMPIMILSGMMFPIENMPIALQAVAQAIPAKWYISATRKIMIKGAGLSAIWKETAVLAAMACALMAASLKQFKTRLE